MTEEHQFQHDADQTELEKWLNSGLTKVEPYSNQILIGFIAATVIAVVTIFWLRSTGEAASAGWTEFVSNEAPDDYVEVAEDNPNTAVAIWAKLQAGRLFLNEGLNTALTNREISDKQLNNAKAAFEEILAMSDVPSAAREEALFGLASALEALSDGDTGPAVKAYEALAQEYPESIHGPWAESRIDSLKTGDAQNFYAWFRKQNPQPTDRPKPQDVTTPAEDMLKNVQLETETKSDTAEDKTEEKPQAPDLPSNPGDEPAKPEMKKDAEKTSEKAADLPAEEPVSAQPDPTKEKSAEKATEPPAEPEATETSPEESPAAPEAE